MTKGLEALESLMNEYYEMCEDTGNNDEWSGLGNE